MGKKNVSKGFFFLRMCEISIFLFVLCFFVLFGLGWKTLHWAVYSGSPIFCRILIFLGADVNAPAKGMFFKGETPLHMAAEFGYYDVCRCLIDAGANVNAKDYYFETPLHKSAKKGFLSLSKYLVSCGADIRANSGIIPGFGIAGGGGGVPASQAAFEGHLDIVKFFISKGIGINERDKCGNTLLHWAARGGRLRVCKYLISHGADMYVWNYDRFFPAFPAFLAAYEGHLSVVKYFVSIGFDVNEKGKDGTTLLHWAARGGRLRVCKYLIKQGANVNARDFDFNTPLIEAEGVDVCRYLILSGADVNSRTLTSNLTALQIFYIALSSSSFELDFLGTRELKEEIRLLEAYGGKK